MLDVPSKDPATANGATAHRADAARKDLPPLRRSPRPHANGLAFFPLAAVMAAFLAGCVPSLADNPVISDAIPKEEGSYLLCVLAGETETVDDSWQPVSFPTVVRVQIDRTPPIVEPELGLTEFDDGYMFEPIFAIAELTNYEVKFGPAAETDCADPEGYMPYRRVPFSADKADDPQTICVIGYDNAGNQGAPKAFYLGAQPAGQ